MKNNKFFALLLSIVLLLTMLMPSMAFAETGDLYFEDGYASGEINTGLGLSIGESHVLSASASNNGAAITYQWYHNPDVFSEEYGNALSNATDSYYEITNADADTFGIFTCVASDNDDTIAYRVRIEINYDDVFFKDPYGGFSGKHRLGRSTEMDATLVNADGEEISATYTWYKDGTVLENAKKAKYTINSIAVEDDGEYYCVAKAGNKVLLKSDFVNVDLGLNFVSGLDYEEQQITANDLGKTRVLTVNAYNDDPEKYPLSYQWYFHRDGERMQKIEGATSATLEIQDFSTDNLGNYMCSVWDMCGEISYTIRLSALGFVNEYVWDHRPELGDKVVLDAEASSILGDVDYKWYTLNSNDEEIVLDCEKGQFVIDSVISDDYKIYHCLVSCGKETLYRSFGVWPDITTLEIGDFIVVPGEKLTITGQAKTVILNNGDINDGLVSVRLFELDEYGNNRETEELSFPNTPEELFGGKMTGVYTETVKDGYTYYDFTLNADITEETDGIYAMSAYSAHVETELQKFQISVKDYTETKLITDDGSSIEGTLHPAAKLNMRPLQNHVENYFKQKMPKGAEIIWSNDVTLEIYGIADTHKGELTLHIPVNKKYNGQRLTVYHYINDSEIEELEGLVTDGVLTITSESLSPFAVIAEGDSDDSDLQDPPPGGTWFGHWKNWGGSQ